MSAPLQTRPAQGKPSASAPWSLDCVACLESAEVPAAVRPDGQDDRPNAAGPLRRPVRKKFGRDAPNSLNRIGPAGLGSVFRLPVRDRFGRAGRFGRRRRNSFPVFGLLAPNRALRRTENPRVDGSIPSLATTPNPMKRIGFGHHPRTIGRRGGGNRPTIGLSEIGSVARGFRAAVAGPGGDLANWKTGIIGTARSRRLKIRVSVARFRPVTTSQRIDAHGVITREVSVDARCTESADVGLDNIPTRLSRIRESQDEPTCPSTWCALGRGCIAGADD